MLFFDFEAKVGIVEAVDEDAKAEGAGDAETEMDGDAKAEGDGDAETEGDGDAETEGDGDAEAVAYLVTEIPQKLSPV